jgi:MFS family permease
VGDFTPLRGESARPLDEPPTVETFLAPHATRDRAPAIMTSPVPRPTLATLLPFCFGYYLSYLLRTINAVIAPELVRDLGLGAADLGFLTSTYFLTFALAQLPVGLALDRFGPRRVVSTLLAVTAVGCGLFAVADSFAALAVARALIGLGVAACLMGGLKAIEESFPLPRHTSLTGVIMAAGALGALTASAPLDWALPRIGWRGSLAVTGAASVLGALLVAAAAPKRTHAKHADEHTLLSILRARAFWRFAPQVALYTGGFMALQGLWIVPWLIAVEGSSRAEAARMLLWLNLGMLVGQLSVSFGAGTLARLGLTRTRLMLGSLLVALVVEATIFTRLAHGPAAWLALGMANMGSAQVYGVAAAFFPPQLSGRVSTALNQLAFAGAFAAQWGVGVSVQALAPHAGTLAAYQRTFAVLWLAQLAGVLLAIRRRGR